MSLKNDPHSTQMSVQIFLEIPSFRVIFLPIATICAITCDRHKHFVCLTMDRHCNRAGMGCGQGCKSFKHCQIIRFKFFTLSPSDCQQFGCDCLCDRLSSKQHNFKPWKSLHAHDGDKKSLINGASSHDVACD